MLGKGAHPVHNRFGYPKSVNINCEKEFDLSFRSCRTQIQDTRIEFDELTSFKMDGPSGKSRIAFQIILGDFQHRTANTTFDINPLVARTLLVCPNHEVINSPT